MDKHIEIQYVQQLGVYLNNFKQHKARTWSFSHTCEHAAPGHKLKSRGSIYEPGSNTNFNVKCFHCGYSVRFTTFLKLISPSLYDEYMLNEYRDKNIDEVIKPPIKQPTKKPVVDPALDGLISVNSLSNTHPVIRWLERRHIPKDKYKFLYVAKQFYSWAKRYNTEFKTDNDEPRLVIPYFDKSKKLIGFTARTFSPKVEPRYIHTRINKSETFVYGLDRIDESKVIYVCEGHLDSLFIDNCVAVGGANYNTEFTESIKDKCVIIPDNDWKRNAQVGKQLLKAISSKFSVCLLPDTMKGKDINDYVKNGMSLGELKSTIDKYTYSGLRAKLEFAVNKKY